MMTKDEYFMALNSIDSVGPITSHKLLAAFGTVENVLNASKFELEKVPSIGPKVASNIYSWRDSFNLDDVRQKLKSHNSKFYCEENPKYPTLLRHLSNCPLGIYVKGEIPSLPCVGIVGTRQCSFYGIKFAKKLAYDLAKMGICVVSGLARGIDTAAHEGALEAGGKTVGVLGCGLDIIYPPENAYLYNQMQDNGAIVSEFDFGKKADKTTFPRRNRIISGMSIAIVVIESELKGGSLITAKFALEQNRLVFAVPGRVDSVKSAGCHKLLRDGAILCSCANDIVEDISSMIKIETLAVEKPVVKLDLNEQEQAIYNILSLQKRLSMDQILSLVDMPVSIVQSNLLLLEVKKIIKKGLDGFYELLDMN